MHEKNVVYWDSIKTPHGDVILMATEKGIIWASTPSTAFSVGKQWVQKIIPTAEFTKDQTFPILRKAREELKKYLNGQSTNFSGPFDLHGTAFQVAVWQEMLRIPYGKTKTYGEVAALVGKPKAPRAVGGACNKNPIAILVPCHRIVGSTGSLTGYGGGLPAKKWLLELEKKS